MNKICGIYKITSPSGKVYIGQSIDINKRFHIHKTRINKINSKLNSSFKKYKVENHIFEIILECKIKDLNHFERCFQEIYNSVECGLNCVYVNTDDKVKVYTKEIRDKISKGNRGKIISQETRDKISYYNKNFKIYTEETRLKLSSWQLGKKLRKETIDKLSKRYAKLDENFIIIEEFKNLTHFCIHNKINRPYILKAIRENKKAYGYYWIKL